MKNKIFLLIGCVMFFLGIPHVWGKVQTVLTREGMSLKGNVSEVKYVVYNGRFEDGTFIKGKKSAPFYNSRPCIHTFFDRDGRIVEEADYNVNDECVKRVKYRYNQRGLLLYKERIASNGTGMNVWRFTYDNQHRLAEYRMYQYYIHGRSGKSPEKLFFDLGEVISGVACSYDEKGNLIEMNKLDNRWGREVFCYTSGGNLVEREVPNWEWMKVEYTYDTINRLTGITYSRYHPIYRATYAYAEDGYLSEEETYAINYNKRDSLQFSGFYAYDSNGLLVRKYSTDGKVYEYIYEKNEQGDVTIESIYYNGELHKQAFYEYEYDGYGNWTARYEFQGYKGIKGPFRRLEERVLEYY